MRTNGIWAPSWSRSCSVLAGRISLSSLHNFNLPSGVIVAKPSLPNLRVVDHVPEMLMTAAAGQIKITGMERLLGGKIHAEFPGPAGELTVIIINSPAPRRGQEDRYSTPETRFAASQGPP